MLDQSGMQHLMGYRLTLAEVAARRVFQRHIGTPFKLRPVEFTILVLLLGNGTATPKQLAQTLGSPPPNVTVLVDRLVERSIEAIPACDGASLLRAMVRAESERLVPQDSVRDLALAA